MGGFKTGATDDDWEDEEDDAVDVDAGAGERDRVDDFEPEPETEPSSRGPLPWIHRRNSITDGREKTVQLHLQESTVDETRDGKNRVENQLGESVKKADLREAALLVGLRHTDEVAEQLREWGYAIE